MPPDVGKWHCRECGAEHDRDSNAARNIRAAVPEVSAHGEPVNSKPLSVAAVWLREVGISGRGAVNPAL